MNKKKKILYTDDEEINLHLFEFNFSKKYDVITANGPYDGLKYLKKLPEIEVVISDMRMPVMNGLEFIQKAKKNHSDKKYFILTGFDITVEIEEALESKLIDKYLSKPFNVKEIEMAIEEVVI